MMNLTINLPILITLSGGLTLFFYSYRMRLETAVILATIPMKQQLMKETK